MTWIDYAILGIIALSAWIGFVRGFMRETFSFVIWFSALLVAWTFYKDLADELARWIAMPIIRIGVAALVLILVVLILGAALGYLLSMLLEKTGLTDMDRILGALFGAARGIVLIAMLVFFVALTPLLEADWWQDSFLVGAFQFLAGPILDQIPTWLVDRLKSL